MPQLQSPSVGVDTGSFYMCFVPLRWWWCGHSVLTDLYITPFSCVVNYLKKP